MGAVSTPPNPWSDPATETEPGAPYAGPPPTTPYRSAPGGWPGQAAPYAQAWPQPWPQPWPPPARRGRPGQVIGAAVLAFLQAAAVALATAYLQLLGSVCPRFGIDVTLVDATQPGAFGAAVEAGRTVLVLAESPANPRLDLVDLDELRALQGPFTVLD